MSNVSTKAAGLRMAIYKVMYDYYKKDARHTCLCIYCNMDDVITLTTSIMYHDMTLQYRVGI